MLFILLSLLGCTDVDVAKTFNYGTETYISCWSGGEIIYYGHSTGRIAWHPGGGASWVDSRTNKLMETYADCIYEVGQ